MITVTTTAPQRRPARSIGSRIAVCGALVALLAGCAGGPAASDPAINVNRSTASTPSAVAPAAPSQTSAARTPASTNAPLPAATPPGRTSGSAPADAGTPGPSRPPAGEAASANPPPSITDAIRPAAGALILPASPPVSLSVPAIGVQASLIDLAKNADGTVEVPSLEDPNSPPGWYKNSPSPGTLGPAIILGHIDSRLFGPGVFFSLHKLQQGDEVDVTRADGKIAIFTIDAVKTVAKSNFPTREVYGNLDHAGLRLITCGGQFDPDARSYESNVIVFASLTGSRST